MLQAPRKMNDLNAPNGTQLALNGISTINSESEKEVMC